MSERAVKHYRGQIEFHTTRAHSIARKAEAEGRGMTPDERSEVAFSIEMVNTCKSRLDDLDFNDKVIAMKNAEVHPAGDDLDAKLADLLKAGQ